MPEKKSKEEATDQKETKEKEKVDFGLLEEDDEFEEFPAEDGQGKPEDDDLTIWEDNWDDDNVEDDFCNQLKSELEKQKLDSTEQMQ